jgi:hypothetical protein
MHGRAELADCEQHFGMLAGCVVERSPPPNKEPPEVANAGGVTVEAFSAAGKIALRHGAWRYNRSQNRFAQFRDADLHSGMRQRR